MINYKDQENQRGQALLFVVITMTIALALGIGLSLETISSVSNVSDTDTSQRALAAAEGAAERALSLSDSTLQSLVTGGINQSECRDELNGDYNSSTGECFISFESGADGVRSRSKIIVDTYETVDTTPSDEHTPIVISQDKPHEVFLETYSVADGEIDVCWNGDVAVYYRLYKDTGESLNEIVCPAVGSICSSWNLGASGSGGSGVNQSLAVTGSSIGHNDYDSCVVVNANPGGSYDPKGLRIRALGATGDVEGAIYPDIPLPTQGFKIDTEGQLLDSSDIVRRVTVYKSFEYVPVVFDFSLYSESTLQ